MRVCKDHSSLRVDEIMQIDTDWCSSTYTDHGCLVFSEASASFKLQRLYLNSSGDFSAVGGNIDSDRRIFFGEPEH